MISNKLGTLAMQADDSKTIAQLKKYLSQKFPVLKGDSYALCIKYKNCVLSNSEMSCHVGCHSENFNFAYSLNNIIERQNLQNMKINMNSLYLVLIQN